MSSGEAVWRAATRVWGVSKRSTSPEVVAITTWPSLMDLTDPTTGAGAWAAAAPTRSAASVVANERRINMSTLQTPPLRRSLFPTPYKPSCSSGLKVQRRAPEGFNQRRLRTRLSSRQKPALRPSAWRKLWVSLQIAFQRIGRGLRLMDQGCAGGKNVAKKICDDLVVRAAQYRPVRRTANPGGDRPDVDLDDSCQRLARRPGFDHRRKLRARL